MPHVLGYLLKKKKTLIRFSKYFPFQKLKGCVIMGYPTHGDKKRDSLGRPQALEAAPGNLRPRIKVKPYFYH